MEFNNYTPFAGIAWETLDAYDKWSAVILSRVRFKFEKTSNAGELKLVYAKDQGELFEADEFYGDVVSTSIRYESDFVTYKKNTDVILNANAVCPNDKKSTSWNCKIKIFDKNETLLKDYGLYIKGEKISERLGAVWTSDFRQSQKEVAIRYEKAYGGSINVPSQDENKDDKSIFYDEINPVGCGVKKLQNPNKIVNSVQIEYLDKKNKNAAAGFGFIGRSWKNRLAYVGTYDDKWLKNQHPLPPFDFDERYNQSAHPELIMNGYLQEGTRFELYNLKKTYEKYYFTLPSVDVISRIKTHTGDTYHKMDLDTVIIDINDEDENEHSVYLSFRTRVKITQKITQTELMLIPNKENENG